MKQTKISYSQSNVTPMVVKVWSLDQHQNPPETCEKSEFSGPTLGLLIPRFAVSKKAPEVTTIHA